MDFSKYKYKPEQFPGMLNLQEDLTEFYQLTDRYEREQSKAALLAMRFFWCEQLFFSIKHQEIGGGLAPYDAEEIRDYLEDLVYAH